jgi:hypothetical protein
MISVQIYVLSLMGAEAINVGKPYKYWRFCTMVGVAQLVERRTVAPNVVGSNPIAHPKPSWWRQVRGSRPRL